MESKTAVSVIVVLGSFALAASPASQASPNPPAGPQCFGMACCAHGQAARGMDSGALAPVCVATKEAAQDCFVDYRTERAGAHACPAGTYVRGFLEKDNLLTCCFDRERGFSELEGEQKKNGSKGHPVDCAAGEVMTGAVHGKEEILCAKARVPSAVADPVRITLDPEGSRSYEATQPLEMWRRATHNWLARMMEIPPGQETPRAPAIKTQNTTVVKNGFVDVTRKHVTYPSAWREGGEIPAYLFLPAGYREGGSYPSAVVLHGHPVVTSIEGKEETGRTWRSYYHAVGLYLAQNGFITLVPDLRTFGEFEHGHEHNDTSWNHKHDLPRRWLRDAMTSVSALLGVPGVKADSVGMAGLSLGGFMTLLTSAMDPRIKAAVVSGIYVDLPKIDHCQTIEGIQNRKGGGVVLHTKDLTTLLAPRPLEITMGMEDKDFYPPFVSEHQADSAKDVYDRLVHAPSKLRINAIRHFEHRFDGLTTTYFLRDQLLSGAEKPKDPVKIDSLHCPAGHAMVGANLQKHDAVCRALGGAKETCSVDEKTQRDGMHACPAGAYIRDIDDDTKKLTCCVSEAVRHPYHEEARDPIAPLTQDDATQSQGMHVCPSFSRDGSHAITQTVMTGIEAAQNRFLCAY